MAFYGLANLIDLYDGLIQAHSVGGRRLLLIHDQGATHIIEDRCPHMDAPLASGKLANGSIRCRSHGIEFELESGKALGPLADSLSCLNRFDVAYEGCQVGIDL